MNNKKLLLAAAVALVPLAVSLSGCGERPVTAYKQGTYQGKKDTQPWSNERFKDDRAVWEDAIKQRTQSQNEYTRVAKSAN